MKLKRIKELTINVRTWQRGREGSETMLRTKNGRQCCLGFACEAAGVGRDKTLGAGNPYETRMRVPLLSRLDPYGGHWRHKNTQLSRDCIDINDDPAIRLPERMAKLTRRFARAGVKVTFINIPKHPEKHL